MNAATHAARRTFQSRVTDLKPALRCTADRIRADLHTVSHCTHVPRT